MRVNSGDIPCRNGLLHKLESACLDLQKITTQAQSKATSPPGHSFDIPMISAT